MNKRVLFPVLPCFSLPLAVFSTLPSGLAFCDFIGLRRQYVRVSDPLTCICSMFLGKLPDVLLPILQMIPRPGSGELLHRRLPSLGRGHGSAEAALKGDKIGGAEVNPFLELESGA